MKYSTSFRNGILKKVLSPENRSVYAVAKEAEISAITINSWLAKLDRKGLRCAYIKSYRAGRHTLHTSIDDSSPGNLHEWRKQVKRLYYGSLALHAAGHGMNHRIRRSHRLGHLLGEEHDLHLMQNLAADSRETAVVKKIRARRESLRKKIFRIGRKLYDCKPGKLDRRLR